MFLESPDTAEAARLYQSDLDGQGYVMNLSRVWAWRPDVCEAFAPARRLYARFGFEPCGPFADYVEDPYSVFMTREI